MNIIIILTEADVFHLKFFRKTNFYFICFGLLCHTYKYSMNICFHELLLDVRKFLTPPPHLKAKIIFRYVYHKIQNGLKHFHTIFLNWILSTILRKVFSCVEDFNLHGSLWSKPAQMNIFRKNVHKNTYFSVSVHWVSISLKKKQIRCFFHAFPYWLITLSVWFNCKVLTIMSALCRARSQNWDKTE